MRRDGATWYAYLLLGFFTYLLNIQGNILPFLKLELDLSYRVVSLHSSAIAAGMMLVGLFGDLAVRRYGRRRALWLGAGGAAAGAILLCLAPVAWASIASCALIGGLGALIPAMVPAILSDLHGPRRDIAITEASAVSYAFAIMAPLVMGLSIALIGGWRPAVLTGALFGAVIVCAFRRAPIVDGDGSIAPAGNLPAAYWAYWCHCSGASRVVRQPFTPSRSRASISKVSARCVQSTEVRSAAPYQPSLPIVSEDSAMMSWALTFLIIAIVAAVLGFGGIAGTAAGIAKILFFVALALLVIALVTGGFRRGAPRV